MASIFTATTGPSIIRYLRLMTGVPNGDVHRRLPNVEEITFSSSIFGGYNEATVKISPAAADYAQLESYIGRELLIHDPFGNRVWEGFIDTAIARSHSGELTVGPLLDMATKISLRYTELQFNTLPPIGGEEKTTEFFTFSDIGTRTSLERFGILEDMFIAPRQLVEELGEPLSVLEGYASIKSRMPRNFVFQEGDQVPVIELSGRGYFHLMKKLYVDYYAEGLGDPQGEPLSAHLVMRWPFYADAAGFFNMSGVEPTWGGDTLYKYNEEAESAYDFLETNFNVLYSLQEFGYTLGLNNYRTLIFHKNIKPTWTNLYIGSDQTNRIHVSILAQARPGMWASMTHFPGIVSTEYDQMFLIDTIEVSGDKVTYNKATFDALDRILRERGL